MKIGAKVQFFNYKMREARARLGLTQKELAIISNVNINDVGLIERLCNFPGDKLPGKNAKLCRIASALQMEFSELFPQEYLDMLQRKQAPKRTSAFLWVKEVSLEQLYENQEDIEEFILYDPDVLEKIENKEMKSLIRDVLKLLPRGESQVIDVRYGISSGKAKTLEETAKILNLPTRETVRKVEARAFRRLRHPGHRRKLKDFL